MRAALAFLPVILFGAIGATSDRDADNQAKLAKALAGLTPGKPESCVPLSYPTLSTQSIGKELLYKRDRNTIYVNHTTGGCEGAANGDILVQVEHEGRPCSGDIIRTVDSTSRFTTGSCALGQFVPYTRAPAR